MLVTVIFAIMSIAIMQVYMHVTTLGQRLSASRLLADSAREMTERIASDIRNVGMNLQIPGWTNEYTNSGNTDFYTNANIHYIFWVRKGDTITPCYSDAQCSLFRADTIIPDPYKNALNMVDIFTPDDANKRVKITNLRFFISWDSSQWSMDEPKVTIIATLALTEKSWVTKSLRDGLALTIQTTISERAYKSN